MIDTETLTFLACRCLTHKFFGIWERRKFENFGIYVFVHGFIKS